MLNAMDITPDPVLSNELVLHFVRRHVPGAHEVKHVDETGKAHPMLLFWIAKHFQVS